MALEGLYIQDDEDSLFTFQSNTKSFLVSKESSFAMQFVKLKAGLLRY